MEKRQLIQIPAEQVNILKSIDRARPDLKDYAISKKVHLLLQEKLAEILKTQLEQRASAGKWIEYIREVIPLHTVSTIAMGVVRDSKEMIGKQYTKILVSNNTEKTWWGNWEEDIWAIGEWIIPWLRNKKNRDSHFNKHKQKFAEITEWAENIRQADLKNMSDEELLSEYSAFHRESMKYLSLSFDIDAIDIVLEEKIKGKIKELVKGKDISQFNEAIGAILTPSYRSYMTQWDVELNKIALLIRKNRKVDKEIDDLLKRFWWTELTWSQRNIKTRSKTLEEAKKIAKGDPSKELNRVRKEEDTIKENKERFRRKLGFDKEMEFYLELFETYAVFHDYRKEAQMKCVESLNTILDDLARRRNHRFEDLVWCWPSEIKSLMQGKGIDMNEIKERKKSFFMIVESMDIEDHTGKKAMERRNEEISSAFEGITNFSGTIASPGKAIGKARVCFSSEDAIKKVEEGDILVASMTLPDYVPAMKKAAAIVTDEGGVTCHAAIVSRELKIPCIIGTGFATKVIMDGETIEVNANHNIIKKLE